MQSHGASSRAPKPKFISTECLRTWERKMGLIRAWGKFENSNKDGGIKKNLQRTSSGNNRWASKRFSQFGQWADTPMPQHALKTSIVCSLCRAPLYQSCTGSCPLSNQSIRSQSNDPRNGNYGEHDMQLCIYVLAFAKNVPNPNVKFVHLPKLQRT